MKTFMAFPICSLIFILLVSVVYFYKPRIKSIENSIYKWLVISNIIGLILEILCYFAVDLASTYYLPSIIILKSYVVYILIWSMIFNVYVFMVSKKNYDKKDAALQVYFQKAKKYTLIVATIISIILYFLPIYIFKDGGLTYTYGPITNVLIVCCFIIVSLWIIKCIINFKNLKQKRYIPIIVCIIVLTLILVIQGHDRSILITTTGHTFVVILMFFTIENPDIKMINELNKNRLLVNQTNEDKSNFLFLASNQIKEPIHKIETLSTLALQDKSSAEMREDLIRINNSAHTLSFLVNNIMDISSLDNNNIKVINNKYSLINLVEKIRILKEKEVKDGVDFRISLSSSIPKALYGDSNLLEQILISLLNNSIKYTSEGFIELTANVIVKYDMCRLVISVIDSGKGISIDKVNELLILDEALSKDELERLKTKNVDINTIKKIVSKMGGYFTIKSEENKGTEVKIVIDQKIEPESDMKFENYLNRNSILVASSDTDSVKTITKLLVQKGYDVKTSIYANDVLDRIRLKEEFLYIILDDKLDKRAYEILKTLKKNPKFKIPVIVMLDKDTEFIKEHFLEDGFSDYLLKSKLNEEINRLFK